MVLRTPRRPHLALIFGYGDNLVGGNIPEEDGVDHRVEPGVWLTDGSAEGPPADPQPEQKPAPPPVAGDPAEDADPLLTDLPAAGNAYTAAAAHDAGAGGQQESAYGQGPVYPPGQETPYGPGAGAQGPAYPPGQDLPYGAPSGHELPPNGDGIRNRGYQQPQVPPLPAQTLAQAASVAAKVTAPFAALTKTKGRKKKLGRPAPQAPPVRPAPPERPPMAARPSATDRTAPSRPAPPRTPVTAPTRRAQLVLSRIEPWSVMKFSFMISLVGWVILFVAVAALYYVLSKLGVFHSIQSTITDVTSSKGSTGTDANGQWFSASRILGYTMLVGAVNVVLITALATVGAVIYNLVTHIAGGIEVTLKETD